MPSRKLLSPDDRFGLTLIALCFLFGSVGRGLIESFTVFLLPLQKHFASDRASIAVIFSIGQLAGGLSAPFAGMLFDRFGPSRLYFIGAVLTVAGMTLAALATEIWHFYVFLGLGLGLAGAALGNVPHAALLSRWYRTNLAGAMSIVHSAIGAGALIVVPLAQLLIEQFDWRAAYAFLALGGACLLLPPLWLVPWTRATAGHPRFATAAAEKTAGDYRVWTLGGAMATPAFWGLFAVFLFTANGVFSYSPQIVAYLIEAGWPPLVAASAYGVIGALTPVGMIGFAWADRYLGRRRSMALSYAMSLVAIGLLWAIARHSSLVLLALFILFQGLTFGSRGPLVTAIAARTFRGDSLGGILGTIMLGGGIGAAIGSFTGGLLHDLAGGYDAVLAYGFVSLCIGSAPFWTVRALARD